MYGCPLQYSSRTLHATQFKPGLLPDKLSEDQMSYFYLCLSVSVFMNYKVSGVGFSSRWNSDQQIVYVAQEPTSAGVVLLFKYADYK